MYNLNAEDYNQILKFISDLQKSHDDYRHLVVLLLAQYFNFDHAIFFLANEENEMVDPITINVCDDFLKNYQYYYFYRDLFYPKKIHDQIYQEEILTVTDFMSYKDYEKTEFYNDFMMPSNYYYQIGIPLISKNKLIGGIGIIKPKYTGDFNERELSILKTLKNHIAANLDIALQLNSLRTEHKVFQHCISQLSTGYIILNENHKPIDFNDAAKNLCQKQTEEEVPHKAVHIVIDKILEKVSINKLNDKSQISTNIDSLLINIEVMPALNKSHVGNFLIISLREETNLQEKLIENYGLTNRESEIAQLFLHGYSNKDIANKLLVSVHTIKAHNESIYKKMKVNKRAEVIHKILKHCKNN